MEDTLRALQIKFNTAELHDDRPTLEKLIDKSFTSIGPKGFLLDKTQWINRHEHFVYHALDSSEYRITAYSDFGVVITRHENRSEYQGNQVHFTMRETQVWRLVDGQWRIVCLQFSPID